MTENERIAKVLGWERKSWAPDIDRDGEEFGHDWYRHDGSRVADPDTKRDEENYEGYLPDWPNDIAACVRDLVPKLVDALAAKGLDWVHSPFSLCYGAGKWECEVAYPDPDPNGDLLYENESADTAAAAICVAFLAAFDPENEVER